MEKNAVLLIPGIGGSILNVCIKFKIIIIFKAHVQNKTFQIWPRLKKADTMLKNYLCGKTNSETLKFEPFDEEV
jgi:hypothetical protein